MNEEHRRVVKELERENVKKYGEICKNPKCKMHARYCRCENSSYNKDSNG